MAPMSTASSSKTLLDFAEVAERLGLPLSGLRLLRHDRNGLMWFRRGRARFAAFASYQYRKPDPYRGARTACHFVPGPPSADSVPTGLFVGATTVDNRRLWTGVDRPELDHPDIVEPLDDTRNVFDLAWVPHTLDWSERILIEWGVATRAWSQWPGRSPKPVLEIRARATEPPFPGFADFLENVADVPILPQAWRSALASVGGVYLLTCLDTGRLYVGSATGAEGFLARWTAYAETGHGGNRRLVEAGRRNYMVSVLEVASPSASWSELLAREAAWKRRLGSRAHGLNAN